MKTEILTLKLADLVPTQNNPRQINKNDFEQLKKSVKEFPEMLELREVVIDENNRILGGHQRVKALMANGETEVTVKRVTGLTERQKDEFVIRDNVQNGDWDMDVLANSWNLDDLQAWGVKEIKPYKEINEVDAAPVDDKETFSVIGKIYHLGDHRVFCGSFEDDNGMRGLFGDRKATMTFTDPPYNVGYTSADGKSIQNDKMAENDFEDFLNKAFECVAKYTTKGGGIISWMSTSELFTLWRAMQSNGLPMKQIICWVKSSFTLGRSDFQFQHEPAIYGISEGKYDDSMEADLEQAIYTRSGGEWCGSRKLSTCWFFDKPSSSKDHPTMKPIGLCAKGVLALSKPDDIVFDPFLGSGSTLIACEQTGRRCFGSEIDPRYCDVIRKRYWKLKTGSEEGWQEGTE